MIMNQSPDSVDRVRESITEQHRNNRMARLRQLETDGRLLSARVAEVVRALKEHTGRVRAMIDEVRQRDETTIRIPRLPER